MKHMLVATLLLSLLSSTAVTAQSGNSDRAGHGDTQSNVDRKDQTPDKTHGNRATPAASDSRAAAPAKQNDRARRDQATQANKDLRNQYPPAARTTTDRQSDRPRFDHAAQADRDLRKQYPPAVRSVPSQNFGRSSRNNPVTRADNAPRWSRGDRLPDQYRQRQYVVSDWQQHGLRRPPPNYHWVRDDNNDFFLALITTGVISDVISRNDRDREWDRGYSRRYSYDDDVYYRDCRNGPDPAGVLVGGLIGGLLGNAAGHGGTGATIAGVIFGGAVGAALTSNMDCEDRSYAYKTYYNGFNAGRAGGRYQWRNPHNDHRGEFRINSYYNDPYGFRCARFNQVTYIHGRSYAAKGVACRQPDGSWAAVN